MRLGIVPTAVEPRADDAVALRVLLDDLVHAGHVVVDAADMASRVWLEATRRYPEAEIILFRTHPGYRIEMEFKRNL